MAYDPISDTPDKIVAGANRYREDAIQQLADIEAGKTVPAMTGTTREGAIELLYENIRTYEQVMRKFGWKGDA